jgi:hypothetical protein
MASHLPSELIPLTFQLRILQVLKLFRIVIWRKGIILRERMHNILNHCGIQNSQRIPENPEQSE